MLATERGLRPPIQLRHISPHELSSADVLALAKAQLRAYDNPDGAFLINLALKDKLRLYKIEGGMDGLIGLELHEYSRGVELWVSFVAGRGALEYIEEIWEELKKIKDLVGAKTIATMAKGKALQRLYERKLGLQPFSVLYREEVQ